MFLSDFRNVKKWFVFIGSFLFVNDMKGQSVSLEANKTNIKGYSWDTLNPYVKYDKDSNVLHNWSGYKNSFVRPVKGKLNRGFGKGHAGDDIQLSLGDTVNAAWEGVVRFAAYSRDGYGNLVIIRHYNGTETWYAHLSKIMVSSNDTIYSTQSIGLGGRTGRATGVHLHLELRYHGITTDLDHALQSLDPCDCIYFKQHAYSPIKKSKHKKSNKKNRKKKLVAKKSKTPKK
jgi:murein DD-endopeptidase MepM/ murein hydrolase activator NlpD